MMGQISKTSAQSLALLNAGKRLTLWLRCSSPTQTLPPPGTKACSPWSTTWPETITGSRMLTNVWRSASHRQAPNHNRTVFLEWSTAWCERESQTSKNLCLWTRLTKMYGALYVGNNFFCHLLAIRTTKHSIIYTNVCLITQGFFKKHIARDRVLH